MLVYIVGCPQERQRAFIVLANVPLGAEIRDVRALLDVVHAAEGRRKKVLLPDGRSLDAIMPTASLESLFRGEEGAEPAAKKVKTA